jgi:endonuclease/exonuclease/phosphatase (EEP) superfamily protein YafD
MLKTIIHITIALASAIMLLLPHLPSHIAGYLIYLSLRASILLAIQATTLLVTSKKRNPLWWAQAILLAASIATYGSNYIPGGEQQPSGDRMRIVSWNVENFHIKSDTLKKAAQLLNSLNADIICLQERPHDNLLHRDSIRAAFPGHPHFCTNDREDEVLNVAILSKYPLSNVETHYFDPGYNKMITAEVETPQGAVTLWNVHLQTTGGNPAQFISNAQRRNEQAQELKEKTRQCSTPAIVCGDFNDTPASYAYRTLAQGMHDCHSTAGERFGWPEEKWVQGVTMVNVANDGSLTFRQRFNRDYL